RRLLLPQREPEDAQRAERLPAGADRRTDARVRRRGGAAGCLRADDPRPDAGRRQALLHQQPADRARAGRARRRPAARGGDGMKDDRARWAGRAGVAVMVVAMVAALGAQQLPPAQTPLQRLQGAIETITRSINATWGIYIKSIETGEEIAVDADR